MSPIGRSSIAAMLATLAAVQSVPAQAPASAEPAHVLVLGTYHFANPGLDVVQAEVTDVLSAPKQAEIRAVVEGLARFQPTRIAVESVPAAGPRLDSLYDAFRSGRHELSRDETEQLGFRIAAMLDHSRVYPIDHRGDFPFDAVMEYAKAHDPDFVTFANEEIGRIAAEKNRQQRENTIGEILRLSNDPEKLARDHGTYLRFAEVGAGDSFVGAELLSKWYERNIHIFANLRRVAKPGERILVIVGSGHAPILRELITYHPELRLVNTLEYLSPAPLETVH